MWIFISWHTVIKPSPTLNIYSVSYRQKTKYTTSDWWLLLSNYILISFQIVHVWSACTFCLGSNIFLHFTMICLTIKYSPRHVIFSKYQFLPEAFWRRHTLKIGQSEETYRENVFPFQHSCLVSSFLIVCIMCVCDSVPHGRYRPLRLIYVSVIQLSTCVAQMQQLDVSSR